MYTFLFDRRSLTLFICGAVLVGVLLFGSGVVVGMRLSLPPPAERLVDFEPLSEVVAPFEQGAEDSEPADEPARSAPAEESAPAPAVQDASREPGEVVEERIAEHSPPVAPPAPRAAPEPPAPKPRPRVANRSGFTVQVGAYGVAENARRTLDSLAAEGLDAYEAKIVTSSGSTLTAVRFGSFADRAAAQRAVSSYLAAGADREAVVRPPA